MSNNWASLDFLILFEILYMKWMVDSLALSNALVLINSEVKKKRRELIWLVSVHLTRDISNNQVLIN